MFFIGEQYYKILIKEEKIVKKGIVCILICMLFVATNMLVIGQRTKNITSDDTIDYEHLAIGKTWMKILGGKDYDIGCAIQHTSDGGYIIVGCTNNYGIGGHDVWLIKTDMNGDEVWNTSFGTPTDSSETERGNSVLQTPDNGYMITAQIDNDLWLIKTDEHGIEEWIQVYSNTTGYSMCQSDDDCFVIVGGNHSFGGLWMLKVDSGGNEIWQKTFANFHSYGVSIKQTSDQGYLLGGYSCIVKTDENGTEHWNITLSDGMRCNDVLQNTDGTYAAIGWKGTWTKNNSGWLMKLDTDGTILFLKNYRGLFTKYIFNTFHQTSDGGYVITGEADLNIGFLGMKLCIIKTNENGILLWRRTYGNGFSYDFGVDIIELSDDGYIVLGGTNSYGAGSVDIWLIKTNSDGRVQLPYRFLNLFPLLRTLLVHE